MLKWSVSYPTSPPLAIRSNTTAGGGGGDENETLPTTPPPLPPQFRPRNYLVRGAGNFVSTVLLNIQ
jgi:hypothetical protein